MSITYEIGIMANKNVADALDEFFENADAKRNWSKYEKKQLADGSTMFRTWTNNHPSWYEIGKKFLATMHEFSSSKIDDDAYRCIMISDEGSSNEYSNDIGRMIFEDFNYSKIINYPESFEAADDISEIETALKASTYDKSSEVMAVLLTDSNVSTYKTFENLAGRYICGNSDLRKGIDVTLTLLLDYNMKEIANKIAN